MCKYICYYNLVLAFQLTIKKKKKTGFHGEVTDCPPTQAAILQ